MWVLLLLFYKKNYAIGIFFFFFLEALKVLSWVKFCSLCTFFSVAAGFC